MSLAVSGATSALAARQAQTQTAQAQSNPAPAAPIPSATVSPSSGSVSNDLASPATALGAVFAVGAGLGHAASAAESAESAGHDVLSLLQQIKTAAGTAADVSTASTDRAALDANFQSLLAQLRQRVDGATAGGTNLVDGSLTSSLKVAANADGGQISLAPQNLSLGGPVVGLAGATLATATGAAQTLGEVTTSLSAVSAAVASLGVQARQIGAHTDFVAKLGASLGAQAGGVNTSSADGVRLQALQLQQDLAGLGGGIANTAPQALLALFRS